jgi:hypothetical protein
MILTTHATVGAAAALAFKNKPWLGLILAFISHFVLDAIPHWHYPIRYLKRELKNSKGALPALNGGVIRDLALIGVDFALGMGISALAGLRFAPENFPLVLIGAALGTLPDLLQLLYYLFPAFPFTQIQRFHLRIHSGKRLDNLHLTGIGSQAVIVAGCLYLVYLLS